MRHRQTVADRYGRVRKAPAIWRARPKLAARSEPAGASGLVRLAKGLAIAWHSDELTSPTVRATPSIGLARASRRVASAVLSHNDDPVQSAGVVRGSSRERNHLGGVVPGLRTRGTHPRSSSSVRPGRRAMEPVRTGFGDAEAGAGSYMGGSRIQRYTPLALLWEALP